jgi:hypothetical protein
MSQMFIPPLNDPDDDGASLIELESLFIAFHGCINDVLNVASSEQKSAQALTESVGCGEMWQAILWRQLERNCHIESLLSYLNNATVSVINVEDAEKALQLSLRILTDDGLQLLDLKRKLGNAMYVHIIPVGIYAHTDVIQV